VPALDGLRGLALLGVLAFHANGFLRGGYLGVDLFFVLSGYLITALLVAEERATGDIALGAFWVRRARRLFPALLALMPAIGLYARFLAPPGELAAIRADALATLGYVANWRAIWSEKSYWDLFVAPSPLEHTWSLAIEEQFYVLWPLVVLGALRRAGRRGILVVAMLVASASMAAMALAYARAGAARAYFGTDARATGLALGAALAVVWPRGKAWSARAVRAFDAAGLAGAALLAYAWCTLEGEDPLLYHGGFWLTEAAALALVACAMVGRASLVGRALAAPPLALLGTVSYGVYLWHWPVNVALTAERVHVHGAALVLLRTLVTFAIAIASYPIVEQPIRRRGVPFGRPLVVVPAATALAAGFVVLGTRARAAAATSAPVLTAALPPLPASGDSDAGAVSEPPAEPITLRVMLVGDSTANSLGWGIRGVHAKGVAIELKGQDGCTLLADMCGGSEWASYARELAPDATLVFVGGAFLHGLTLEGRWRRACYRGWDAKFGAILTRRLAGLATADTRVWAVTVPYPLGPYDSAPFRAEVDCINRAIRKAAAATPGVEVLDLAEHLCPEGACDTEVDGVVTRPDGVHFSMEGGAAIGRWVLDRIQTDPLVVPSPHSAVR
jgi:peptidoglycan/LPS O-acetylase OafA/YrhL